MLKRRIALRRVGVLVFATSARKMLVNLVSSSPAAFRATCWGTGSVVHKPVALSAIVTRDAASSTLVGATSLSLFIGNKRARKPLIAPNRLMT